jgi:hypothetical protein
MSQDPSLGDFRVFARRSLQAKNAFQALERHLDTPAGTVKIADFGAGPSLGFERCDENDPFGGGERAAEDGVAFSLRSAERLGSRYFGGSGGFAEGNKAQCQGWGFVASDPGLSPRRRGSDSQERLGLRRRRERPADRMACLSRRASVPLSSQRARQCLSSRRRGSAPRSHTCASRSGCMNPRSAMRMSPSATSTRSSCSPPFSSVSAKKLNRSAGRSKAPKRTFIVSDKRSLSATSTNHYFASLFGSPLAPSCHR